MGNATDHVAQMSAIWSEVLGTEVGPDDEFFAFGVKLLSAVQIEELVGVRLNLEIEFRDFFRASTPRLLVQDALIDSTDEPNCVTDQ